MNVVQFDLMHTCNLLSFCLSGNVKNKPKVVKQDKRSWTPNLNGLASFAFVA